MRVARCDNDDTIVRKDARLVRKTVEVTILDREQQIRQLYDDIFAGVASKRAAMNQQRTSVAPPMDPSSLTA